MEAGRPKDALQAFERAERALPTASSDPLLAEVNNGRALAWSMIGNVEQAIAFEETAIRLAPQVPSYWNQLAHFYDLQGRAADAQRARDQAAEISIRQKP